MTTDHAGAAGSGLRQIDRITPGPEGHLVANMLGLIAGMGIMTGRADPAFLAVDMEKMEVVVAVPETGKGGGALRPGDITIVAAEAKIVFVLVVGAVELRRIVAGQQFIIQGTMDIMTGRAIAGLDRTVPVAARTDDLAELGVTAETQLLHGVAQQRGVPGRMRPMTLDTQPLADRRVFYLGAVDCPVDFRGGLPVAAGAKGPARLFEHVLGFGAVGVMAGYAALRGRGMDILHREILLAVLVALKAEGAARQRGNQQRLVVGGMGPVAGEAIALGHRSMLAFPGKHALIVTGKTEAAG